MKLSLPGVSDYLWSLRWGSSGCSLVLGGGPQNGPWLGVEEDSLYPRAPQSQRGAGSCMVLGLAQLRAGREGTGGSQKPPEQQLVWSHGASSPTALVDTLSFPGILQGQQSSPNGLMEVPKVRSLNPVSALQRERSSFPGPPSSALEEKNSRLLRDLGMGVVTPEDPCPGEVWRCGLFSRLGLEKPKGSSSFDPTLEGSVPGPSQPACHRAGTVQVGDPPPLRHDSHVQALSVPGPAASALAH